MPQAGAFGGQQGQVPAGPPRPPTAQELMLAQRLQQMLTQRGVVAASPKAYPQPLRPLAPAAPAGQARRWPGAAAGLGAAAAAAPAAAPPQSPCARWHDACRRLAAVPGALAVRRAARS